MEANSKNVAPRTWSRVDELTPGRQSEFAIAAIDVYVAVEEGRVTSQVGIGFKGDFFPADIMERCVTAQIDILLTDLLESPWTTDSPGPEDSLIIEAWRDRRDELLPRLRKDPYFTAMILGTKATEGGTFFERYQDGIYLIEANSGHIREAINFSPNYGECLTPWTLPWLLYVFQFTFSRRVRRELYEPSYQDILADYFEARQTTALTRPASIYIRLCLLCRTIALPFSVAGVTLREGLLKLLKYVCPPALLHWIATHWNDLFNN